MVKIVLKQSSETAVQVQNSEFTITVDRPVEKGGGGTGLMGGQYMLTGIGGCFASTLFAAAQSREVEINGLKIEVSGSIGEESPKRFTDVTLDVSYETCSHPEEFEKLLVIAEQGCISVNTMKNGIAFSAKHA